MGYQYWFMDFVSDEEGRNLYFFGANIRGFFKWDLRTNMVSLLEDMKEYPYCNEMYMNGMRKNAKIYFPPRMADRMAVYDLEHREMKLHELYDKTARERFYIYPSYEGHNIVEGKGGDIFIIYRNAPVCVKWDTLTDSARYIFPGEALEEGVILARDYARIGMSCYFPSLVSNLIIELDMEKEEMYLHRLPGCDSCRYNAVVTEGGRICLLTMDGTTLVFWDPRTGAVDVRTGICAGGGSDHNYRLLAENGKLYAFPMLDLTGDLDSMTVFDMKTGKKEKRPVFETYPGYRKWRTFSAGRKLGYILFRADNQNRSNIFWLRDAVYICVDLESKCVEEFRLPLPQGWDQDTVNRTVVRCQAESICGQPRGSLLLNETSEWNIGRFMEIVASAE